MYGFFQIVGSLGLFLFGMKLMSDGLQKLSGDKLRSIMRSMAGNRVKGVFSGLTITTAVQSSSVTTIMVVSFVNAGLLTLKESIGVIMGANLGTTTTAWVIAFFSFKYSLSTFALPMVGLGVILSFITKKQGCKNFGEFVVGFALLLMGLDFLTKSVPDLGAHPEALQWISHYSDMGFFSVLLFLLFGVVLTMIVQASSVTMAITITMAAKGWISLELAAAIVLGENIGTTITANLAAIPASLNAKRAAFAHFLFNVIGVVWVLAVFHYFIKMVCFIIPEGTTLSAEFLRAMNVSDIASLPPEARADLLSRAVIPDRLALFHTLFNGLNILVLLPFISQMEKIAKWVLKDAPDRKRRTSIQRVEYLTNSLPEMGELALLEGQKELVKLAELSGKMFNGFVYVIQNPDKDLSKEVAELRNLEDESDKLSIALTNFFVQCSAHDLSRNSLSLIARDMIIVPELEDMCDCCYRLIMHARKRYRRQFLDKMLQSDTFKEFCEQMTKFVDFADGSLYKEKISNSDLENALKIREDLDSVRKNLRRAAISQMESSGVTKGGILFIEILSQCERVNSHAMNILEAMNPKGADI